MVFNPKTFTFKPGKAPEPKTVERNKPRRKNNNKKKNYLAKVKRTKELNILEAKKRKENAEKNLESGEYSKALEDINESITLNNSDWKAFFLRGNINIHLNNLNHVMDDYFEAEKWGGDSSYELLALKINLDIAKKEFNKAIVSISNFLQEMGVDHSKEPKKKSLPKFIRFWMKQIGYSIFFQIRGCCYSEIGEYKLAIKDLKTFINWETTNYEEGKEIDTYPFLIRNNSNLFYETCLKNADLNFTIGDFEESISQYSKLINFNPLDVEIYKKRAKIKAVFNDQEGSEKDLKISRIIKKRFSENKQLGDFEVIEISTKIIKIDPKNKIFLEKRALMFEKTLDLELAKNDFTKLISLEPKNAHYFKERARISRILDDTDTAISDISKAIELKPKDYNFFFYLVRANLFINSKNYVAAINDLKSIEKSLKKIKKIDGEWTYGNDYTYENEIFEYYCTFGLAIAEIYKNFEKKNLKNFKKALEYCNKLIDLKPFLPEGFILKCVIFVKCELPFRKFAIEIYTSYFFNNAKRNTFSSYFLNDEEADRVMNFLIEKYDYYNGLASSLEEELELNNEEKRQFVERSEFILQIDRDRINRYNFEINWNSNRLRPFVLIGL